MHEEGGKGGKGGNGGKGGRGGKAIDGQTDTWMGKLLLVNLQLKYCIKAYAEQLV